MMKAIFYILIQSLIILPITGQSNWFFPGAKWSYAYSSFVGYGLSTLEVTTEDTLIGSQVYKKLLSTLLFVQSNNEIDTFREYLFVYEEDNRVYSWDANGGAFLYDFNLAEGDTLTYMQFGGWSPSLFIVDSVGTIDINGVALAFQDIKFEDLFNPGEFSSMRVIERIGSINSHLFHSRVILQPFDAPFYYFRCYEDPDIGVVNVSESQVDCDYIEGITSVDKATNNRTSIAPNPSSDFVTVTTESQRIDKVYVVDIWGTIRQTNNTTLQESITINISELEDGLYFIVGEDRNGEILFSRKVTKY